MNFYISPSTIKYSFIILSSIYLYTKALNLFFTKKTYAVAVVVSFLSSPLVYLVQKLIPLYTILAITLLVTSFCLILFKQNLPQAICISILSVGGSYALFTIMILVTSPVTFLLLFLNASKADITILMFILIGILQNIALIFLFRIRRLRNGIPGIATAFSGNASIFIGAILILFSSTFFIHDKVSRKFDLLLVTFILCLTVIIWLWWQKSIQTDYINQSYSQQIDRLEAKLQERDAELERLSKIIHKDNKLLAALELSTRELLQDASNEKAESLLQELNRFSKERSETLHAYEAGQGAFPETGVFSVDTMIRYLHQRAQKNKIEFQLNLEGDISGITGFIREQDLCTIIADLGENAIIATKDAEIKNIRLSIERKPDSYALYFFDSGEPFAKEVLESLGKKRCTTHAETGGSGIGLMTTSELTEKHHGDFYITEDQVPQPYTKCVAVILKHSSEVCV